MPRTSLEDDDDGNDGRRDVRGFSWSWNDVGRAICAASLREDMMGERFTCW